jgi:hypothetical protein
VIELGQQPEQIAIVDLDFEARVQTAQRLPGVGGVGNSSSATLSTKDLPSNSGFTTIQ